MQDGSLMRYILRRDSMHKKSCIITHSDNAVCARLDDLEKMQDAFEDVHSYLLVNKLQPIVSPYIIKTEVDGKLCFEIYVDVSDEALL